MPTCGVLSLGTREDAKLWYDKVSHLSGFSGGHNVSKPAPSMADMKRVFSASDEWLYIAGHFTLAKHLYNESGTVQIRFHNDGVELKAGSQTEKMLKGGTFKQDAKLKVLFWGGCSVHADVGMIRTLRALFGPVLMLGWTAETGWEMPFIMMGGKGSQPPYPAQNFFEKLGNTGDASAIRNAWLATAIATDWGAPPNTPPYLDRFSVIEPDGSEWVIRNKAITKGRTFAAMV